jgi:hypothetical protein
MKLYHGTTAELLPAISEKGIVPRGRRRGNWKNYPSRNDMVYMTVAYPLFFAFQAFQKGTHALLVEVDSDRLAEESLHPDEDFIAQALSHQRSCSIEDVHSEVRAGLEGYQHHWRDSLAGLGNCCHLGVVPQDAITRYCVVDLEKHKELLLVCDPSISLMNYKFCGEKYKSLVAWLFGERPDYLIGHGNNEMHFKMMESHDPGYRAAVEAMFSNRDGIKVFGASDIDMAGYLGSVESPA